MSAKKIGILTGGGDAPGLNGIIEAVSRTLLEQGYTITGILDGFEGVFGNRTRPITLESVEGLHSQAGTFLGTSNKTRIDGRSDEFKRAYQSLGLSGLVIAGGDGTFASLKQLDATIPVVGVPKTIDNDLQGTEITFGYDTACSVVCEAVDALRATAEAHRRIMLVETMGRTAGWIALGGGLASYADAILIPERPFSKDALVAYVKRRLDGGARGLVFAVSEAARAAGEDPTVAFHVPGSPVSERYGGLAEKMARWLETVFPIECRHVVLGHLQRSRAPTTTDRFLTATMGVKAARLVMNDQWNRAVVYREGRVMDAPLSDIQGQPRTVDPNHRWVQTYQSVGRFI